jgi:hypothetical protein
MKRRKERRKEGGGGRKEGRKEINNLDQNKKMKVTQQRSFLDYF